MIFSKYATNMKTTNSQRSLRNLGLLLLLFEFNTNSLLTDIIDIIETSNKKARLSWITKHSCTVYKNYVYIITIQTIPVRPTKVDLIRGDDS